ncbi:helix-turn-helix domain-containing protein [Nocardia yamanashiensis]|uniref:helix-turn-helix domain-containing protein n=1 Tax=Nocardia yamanashiensis TaxID=209247 RepID=UPI0008376812|nr:helix-turn-helix domain-containing protein [Nocardia yamanashiensis]
MQNSPNPGVSRNLIPLAEGAALARRNRQTLRRWIQQGRLTGWRMPSNRIHVDRDEVLRLLQPQRMQPCTDGDAA